VEQLADWANFYIAGAGAAAAMVGLFIVAVSVNIDPIVADKVLPPRAFGTIATLVLALLTCMGGLMADQGTVWFGGAVLVFGFVAWLAKLHAARRLFAERSTHAISSVVGEAATGQTQTLPFLIGAALVLADQPSGLNWIGFGVLAVFGLSMINVWVLLIEIRR
jgi:hypothetical protein